MTTANILRHAFLLVAGVLLFAFGASRMLTGPVQQLAHQINAHPVQVTTAQE